MDKLVGTIAESQQFLMDHFDSINTALRNQCLSSAGLAIGTSSTAAVKIVSTVTYLNLNVFKSKTTAEVAFTATTHDIAANASAVQEQVYMVCLDGSGAPSLVPGGIVSGAGLAKLPNPSAYAGLTPIGAVRIAVAAGATAFTAGTSALSATQLTVTYYNYGYIAPRFDAVQ